MVRMIGPRGVTQTHLDRVAYSIGGDGLFEVEEKHVEAMRTMGFRVAGESEADSPDTLVEMVSPRGATELHCVAGNFRADAAGIFRIPRKFVRDAQAVGLIAEERLK